MVGHRKGWTLLAACQRGESKAWQQLFNDNADQLYRWAILMGLTPDQAEEEAQRILVKAAQDIHNCYRASDLRAWLYRYMRRAIARRRRFNALKRLLFFITDIEPAFARGIGEATAKDELDTRRCLNNMSRQHAEVLMLTEIENFTSKQAADATGIPEGTIDMHRREARRQFAKQWAKLRAPPPLRVPLEQTS